MMTIYEPRGRAAEYSLLGLNLYRGCSGRCFYCYVPVIPGQPSRELFHAGAKVRPGVLDHLARNAEHFRGTNRRVLLSFTSDPYNRTEKKEKVTQMALRLLRLNNIPFQILTKHAKLAGRDFDLYRIGDAFAVTLTSLSPVAMAHDEPGTDGPGVRLEALERAHSRGIFTWVSLEPVLDPEVSLEIIRRTHDIVDHYKIGTLNHVDCSTTPKQWRQFAKRAVDLCTAYGRSYYIKTALARLIDFEYKNTDERRVGGVAEPAPVVKQNVQAQGDLFNCGSNDDRHRA